MALRYRDEYVISSLRTAYAQKHCDDSLLLDEGYDFMMRNQQDPGNIEAEIINLRHRLQTDHQDSSNPVTVSEAHDTDEDEHISHDTTVNTLMLDTTFRSIKPQSFDHMNQFGLDIEDDSDFEDNILQATQDIKYTAQAFSQRSDNSHRLLPRVPSPKHYQIPPDSLKLFEKRESPILFERTSRLTSKLNISHRDPREQYMEAIAGLETSGVTGFNIKMHIPGQQKCVDITVKQDCTTHLAIGYALLKANIEFGDANHYNLRIVEDDGEPDEDFPALLRTRPVASYHVDEFAIVKATESEYRENVKKTPNKISFKSTNSPTKSITSHKLNEPRDAGDHTVIQQNPAIAIGTAPALNSNESPNPGATGTEVLSNEHENLVQPIQQHDLQRSPQFGDSSANNRNLSSYSSSFSGSKMESVIVKIYMHPYDPLLSEVFWSDDMAPKQCILNDIFEQMCRDKMMDSEMYVLRKTDTTHQILNKRSLLSQLIPPPMPPEAFGSLATNPQGVSAGGIGNDEPPTVCFELIARRNLPASQRDTRPRSSSRATVTSEASEASVNRAKKKTSNDILQNTVLAMQPLGFYKYPVLRHQQMNFLGRGERELVIDGEYIHIMPPTDWSLLDQPKTTTFHIKQVLRVKQSRKVSTNFSIMVMKPTGPKRYDLESTDTSTTIEIVDRLQRLKSARSKSIIT